MVADRHCVVTHQIHAAEVRFGILQIGFRHAGVDITARQQQQTAPLRRDFLTDAVYQGFLCTQAIFAMIVLPEMAVVIVGVQNGDVVGLILFPGAGGSRQESQGYGQSACGGF